LFLGNQGSKREAPGCSKVESRSARATREARGRPQVVPKSKAVPSEQPGKQEGRPRLFQRQRVLQADNQGSEREAPGCSKVESRSARTTREARGRPQVVPKSKAVPSEQPGKQEGEPRLLISQRLEIGKEV